MPQYISPLPYINTCNVVCRCSRQMTARALAKSLTSCSRTFLHRLLQTRLPISRRSSEYPCTCPCLLSCMQRLLLVPSVVYTASGQLFAPKTAIHPGTWPSFGCWSLRRVALHTASTACPSRSKCNVHLSRPRTPPWRI
jgi:hypothetical protein